MEVVEEAVTRCGLALEFASTALKRDEKIVSVALLQTGLALRYASVTFRRDQAMVLKAVNHMTDRRAERAHERIASTGR